MILSMTSFGRTEKEVNGYRVTLEIRTLNSRYLDTIFRFPKNFLELEDAARKRVAQSIRRGRVEVFAQVDMMQTEQKVPDISPTLARFYWTRLQELHRSLPGTEPPKLENLLGIPHIFEARENVIDRDVIKELLMDALGETLEKTQLMRSQEGGTLLRDITQRLDALRSEVGLIADRKEIVLAESRQRLRDRIQELLGGAEVDESRLLQEVAFMAERSDITEEIVRIRSHLDQMQSLVLGDQPADGRTLDFMTQELHREVNTIGCKSTDLEVVQAVVRMKSETGKLREQVQNIE